MLHGREKNEKEEGGGEEELLRKDEEAAGKDGFDWREADTESLRFRVSRGRREAKGNNNSCNQTPLRERHLLPLLPLEQTKQHANDGFFSILSLHFRFVFLRFFLLIGALASRERKKPGTAFYMTPSSSSSSSLKKEFFVSTLSTCAAE